MEAPEACEGCGSRERPLHEVHLDRVATVKIIRQTRYRAVSGSFGFCEDCLFAYDAAITELLRLVHDRGVGNAISEMTKKPTTS